MTANVTFYGQEKKGILVIPNEFIKYQSGKPTALVKAEKGRPENRELKLGITDGKITEVLSGVNEGETALQEIKKDEKQKGSLFGPPGGAGRRR